MRFFHFFGNFQNNGENVTKNAIKAKKYANCEKLNCQIIVRMWVLEQENLCFERGYL